MIERLQKYLASCGVASRRKCEELIVQGKITVNDKIVTELGFKIDNEKDEVKYNNKVVTVEERKVYILLNKPEKIITSVSDEKGRKTVLDLIKVNERIYPIGRLDYDTSGLLLLTNDGNLYNRLMHPRNEVIKTYIAKVRGIPTEKDIIHFENGVDIGDYITAKASFKIIKKEKNNAVVEIKIHEGKNRQIRRMCSAIGYPVITLKRIAIGNVTLGNLKVGEYRFLKDEELNYLMNL